MAKVKSDLYLRNLAAAAIAGKWTRRGLLHRFAQATGSTGEWRRDIVGQLLQRFGSTGPHANLEAVIDGFQSAELAHCRWPRRLVTLFIQTPTMRNVHLWDVPALPTVQALAAWLDLPANVLLWLADCDTRNQRADDTRLVHYRYRWQPKRSGKFRLLEIPKDRLKAVQSRILQGILDHIPPHDISHAFRAGRSIVSFAQPHVNKDIVIRFDLRDYFPSIPASRVHCLFRTVGYPHMVARLLTGLCTTVIPEEEWIERPVAVPDCNWRRSRHLPQGAPTSPALANLCSRRLDVRLSALAKHVGADYTRYADDLAFSGGVALARSARRFQVMVGKIALDEGFELHYRKSRFMRRGLRQQLAGVVVNAHPNLRRDEYDKLKALLHNCVRLGATSQNRQKRSQFQAYLRGRISFVSQLNPQRGGKLMRLFTMIDWNEPDEACQRPIAT